VGGNRNNQWEWDGNGNENKAKPGSGNGNENEPLGMGGNGIKKSFPLISNLNAHWNMQKVILSCCECCFFAKIGRVASEEVTL